MVSATGGINDINSTINSAMSTFKSEELGLAQTFDNFLLLLTTQLQNQDPTEPLDTNEFTSQLVDFTGVEQAVKTNKNLEEMLALTQSANINSAIIGATQWIGKEVEASGDLATLKDGRASFTYELKDEAASVLIRVINQDGKTVYSTSGQTRPGKYTFTWDGKDGTGNKQRDGVYKIEVSGLDKTNNPAKISTAVIGRVSSVVSGDGVAQIQVGDTLIPIGNVVAVYEPKPTETGGTSQNTESGDTESSTEGE